MLVKPSMQHTKKLYITITEINKMLGFINPIRNLIASIQEHKSESTQEVAARDLQNPAKGVIITPVTHIYLGDVLDHCVLIQESLGQIKEQADGMISLIFNTIAANQNEAMKQLTFVTIVFLPMTFSMLTSSTPDTVDQSNSCNSHWIFRAEFPALRRD